MIRSVLLLILAVVIIPRAPVHAILPPDLIVSTAQSVMGILGLIIASVVLVVASIKNYLLIFLTTPLRRMLFGGVLIGGLILISVSIFWHEEQSQLDQWQDGVDSEIRNAWSQYESVYSAADEKRARQSMDSPAQEVTWKNFQTITENKDFLIVDIRDVYAYEAGYFAGSVHMRLADLLHGRWTELESYKNKPVLLICFLGTTGTIASDFLSAKGFTDLYIPQGGLHETLRRESTPFIGSTRFKYFDEMIDRLSVAEAQTLVAEGALVVDVRSPDKYDEPTPIAPDFSFFREFKTTAEIESFVQSLDPSTTYLSVCNSEASCYQAEMLLHDFKSAGVSAGGTFDTSKLEGLKW